MEEPKCSTTAELNSPTRVSTPFEVLGVFLSVAVLAESPRQRAPSGADILVLKRMCLCL